MSEIRKNVMGRAALLGVMAGMRSAAGPAAMARQIVRHPGRFKGSLFERFAGGGWAKLAAVGQVGEVVMDKMPFLPNRTDSMPLLVRMLAGGGAGVAAFVEAKESPVVGGIVGAVGALVGSYLFFWVRRGAVKVSRLPDPVLALGEDGLVLLFERVVKKSYE